MLRIRGQHHRPHGLAGITQGTAAVIFAVKPLEEREKAWKTGTFLDFGPTS